MSHLKKQILILLIIQKLKNVRVSVFLCAHKCLLISKISWEGAAFVWVFLTWKTVLGSDHPNLTTTGGGCSLCGKAKHHHLEDSMRLSLKLLLGLFFLMILTLLGGSKTCGMISDI